MRKEKVAEATPKNSRKKKKRILGILATFLLVVSAATGYWLSEGGNDFIGTKGKNHMKDNRGYGVYGDGNSNSKDMEKVLQEETNKSMYHMHVGTSAIYKGGELIWDVKNVLDDFNKDKVIQVDVVQGEKVLFQSPTLLPGQYLPKTKVNLDFLTEGEHRVKSRLHVYNAKTKEYINTLETPLIIKVEKP